MPTIERAGARLYFETRGDPSGPPVVMQHPLCSDMTHFDDTSLPEQLVERGYYLIFPESIAHGRSSTPSDPARYRLPERARDVIAVMDELGVDKAAYVAYSMGSWIGCGLLDEHPDRLVGASLGGFDLIRGSNTCGIPRRVTASVIGKVLLGGYLLWPASKLEFSPDRLQGLQRAFNALYEPMPGLTALRAAKVPLLLWSGSHDLYRPHMQRAAAQLGTTCEIFSGHHFMASADERMPPLVLDLVERAWAR